MFPSIKELIELGISIVPTGIDKLPLVKWAQYQNKITTIEEADSWIPPIAAIGGKISGGLVCIDFDDKGICFDEWAYLVCNQQKDLMSKLVIQTTPSGGKHCIYRCLVEIGNKKLAERYPTSNEIDGGEKRKKIVLIETRGEGGYFLIDPSINYKLIQGSFKELAILDPQEHDCLISCAKSFNLVKQENGNTKGIIATGTTLALTPLDDYDSKNNPIPELTSAGWTVVHTNHGVVYLRRPGKTTGISATWNKIPNRFYVFSTSTEFENEHIYKASAVYGILHHNGDWSATARDLATKGYGQKAVTPNIDNSHQTIYVKASDFKDRIFNYYAHTGTYGKEIGLHGFSHHLRIEPGQLNVITGVPTAGKSMFMDFLTMETSRRHQWKWAIFSPENYPMEIHFNKLAHTYLNRRPANKEEIIKTIEFIDDHYRFIDATEDDLNIDAIMGAALECKYAFGINGLVIDPWNEIESNRPHTISETDYIGICLRRLRKFARKYSISLWIVAHPTKLQRNKETGEYPVVSMYDISSSANWYNKVDNGIILHRTKDGIVSVLVAKVKYRDFGKPGTVDMRFNFDTGQYEEIIDSNSLNLQDF
jgi:hypothetical protein